MARYLAIPDAEARSALTALLEAATVCDSHQAGPAAAVDGSTTNDTTATTTATTREECAARSARASAILTRPQQGPVGTAPLPNTTSAPSSASAPPLQLQQCSTATIARLPGAAQLPADCCGSLVTLNASLSGLNGTLPAMFTLARASTDLSHNPLLCGTITSLPPAPSSPYPPPYVRLYNSAVQLDLVRLQSQ